MSAVIIGILLPLVGTMLGSALGVALPYLLAFAAGAMMYVVIEDLIPETAQGRHTWYAPRAC